MTRMESVLARSVMELCRMLRVNRSVTVTIGRDVFIDIFFPHK